METSLTEIAMNAAMAAVRALHDEEIPGLIDKIKSTERQPIVFGVDVEDGDDGSAAGFRLGCEMYRHSVSDMSDTDPFNQDGLEEAKAVIADVIVVAVRRPHNVSVEFRGIGAK